MLFIRAECPCPLTFPRYNPENGGAKLARQLHAQAPNCRAADCGPFLRWVDRRALEAFFYFSSNQLKLKKRHAVHGGTRRPFFIRAVILNSDGAADHDVITWIRLCASAAQGGAHKPHATAADRLLRTWGLVRNQLGTRARSRIIPGCSRINPAG